MINGFEVKGIKLTIELSTVVCDAPDAPHAFEENGKGHTGYHGYVKFLQDGVSQKIRMAYLRNDMALRTDQTFRDKTDLDHRSGTSPFEKKKSQDMVSGFAIDYLHLVSLM